MEDKNDVAAFVAGNLPSGKYPQVIIDVILLGVLSAVVSELVHWCFDKMKEPKTVKSPNMIQRVQLKRMVKRNCPSKDYFRTHGDAIHEALLNSGQVATPDQIVKLGPVFMKGA